MSAGKDGKAEVLRMLRNSQTKIIAPIVLLGILERYLATGSLNVTDAEIRRFYEGAVQEMKEFLGHDVHFGAKYYDAYGSRMSRYGVLEQTGHLTYRLLPPYSDDARELRSWLPERIKAHIEERLGIVPLLHDVTARVSLAASLEEFCKLVRSQIDRSPANFEIFTFAVIKVHLEKFACRIYRDTRTASHDKGVDISTNFGVVYQIKKLRIQTQSQADEVYAELKMNFDNERLREGSVILVIDDLSKEVRQYLINMRVQSISKSEVLQMAVNFSEPEDRQKVLRIIYEEFRREYSSRIS